MVLPFLRMNCIAGVVAGVVVVVVVVSVISHHGSM